MFRRIDRLQSALYSLLVTLLLTAIGVAPGSQAMGDAATLTPEEQAITLLERLTPEERVGQLFLVTYEGTEIDPDSPIFDLITNHFVGGVVQLAENDNFTFDRQDPENTIRQALEINRQLQRVEWESSQQTQINPGNGENFTPVYIPLIIGIPQEGDGYSYDQILYGLTPLPNELALGATWNPELAAQVGHVLGQELASLGFNLLLGPSLDVLEDPKPEGATDLGTRTFGGDPYWVGEMGRAYIRGVHEGGGGQVAIVAKHFPGHGSSDRLPEEEVATVRKSLEQLKNFDLLPFFAVTGDATSPEETADALLVSHIRYQGLQGNIRTTTRPISLDPQAFNLLMNLSSLDNWRNDGGVMVSDNLGSLAVRRFYDLTSQTFDARRVTLNAFLAGNDLLYIADFSSESDPDSFTATARTLDFFAQKYREDTAFAERVDESVLRILTLKYRLYRSFTLEQVVANSTISEEIGQSDQVTFEVARQAATLISPSQKDLDDTIPDPPNQSDRIVIITDDRTAKQCSQCPEFPLIDVKELENIVLRRYGPLAGGQVTAFNLDSYSLANLAEMLETDQEDNQLEINLSNANWIVFVMLDARDNIPSFQVLKRFLSERPDLFQQKRLLVYALNAPYYLDATNISKLTAYYGLYSKTTQFVDVVGYLLFRELNPNGALPVSVVGVSYDLNEALFPDPDQIIPLKLDLPQPEVVEATDTPTTTLEPTPPLEFVVGDVIPLRAGIILDRNGNHVPDGSPVEFIITITGGEANTTSQVETTVGGVARTTFAVTNPGTLEVQARSENAWSNSLRFDIPSPGGEISTATPTEQPTEIPPPTPTTITPDSPTTITTEEPSPPVAPMSSSPGFSDWVIAVLISSVIAWGSYRMAALVGQVRWGVRAGFLALIGGLLAYSYLALQMPGSDIMLQGSVSRSVVLVTMAGASLGLLIAISWRVSVTGRRFSNPQDMT